MILNKWAGSMDSIDVAHDKETLRAFVNAVMNLVFPRIA